MDTTKFCQENCIRMEVLVKYKRLKNAHRPPHSPASPRTDSTRTPAPARTHCARPLGRRRLSAPDPAVDPDLDAIRTLQVCERSLLIVVRSMSRRRPPPLRHEVPELGLPAAPPRLDLGAAPEAEGLPQLRIQALFSALAMIGKRLFATNLHCRGMITQIPNKVIGHWSRQ